MQPNGNMPGTGRPAAGAPVSNVNVRPAPVPTPPPAPKPAEPAFGNGGSVVEGKGGKKTGWVLAIVFLLIVAAGGVGFGVWAWMDGNAQKDALNLQISSLKQQNNSLQEQLGNGDTVINIVDGEYQNPVISSGSEEIYSLYLSSSVYVPNNRVLYVTVIDGNISQCMIGTKVEDGVVAYGEAAGGTVCTIEGVSGKIYKIIEFGKGQDASLNYYGFVMEDGTVKYASLNEILGGDSSEINIDKTLDLDGFVVDAIDVNVTTPQGGGYGKTIFVLRDGSFIGFSESMLD